jgi:hypothetical protein
MEKNGFAPAQIRAGLEDIPQFKGLIKNFTRPVFTKDRHNAVTEEDMIMARWTNGKLLEVKFDSNGPYVELDEKTKKYIDKSTTKLL